MSLPKLLWRLLVLMDTLEILSWKIQNAEYSTYIWQPIRLTSAKLRF